MLELFVSKKETVVIVFKEDRRAKSPKIPPTLSESYIFDDADKADVTACHHVVPEISNLKIAIF